MNTARLISIATAVPRHILLQEDVAEASRKLFGTRYTSFDRMASVFQTAGIQKRHAVCPLTWFSEPRGWKERTAAYLEGAQELFIDAASKALARAGLKASEVDAVVTVSSTGIATPSLEARVSRDIGFRTNIQRIPVFGLGCAGGVTGFAIAARLAKAEPGANVLFVALELCTLAFRLDQLTKANMIATALFGDGAAACVLRVGEGGVADVEACGEHTWPDTLDIMGWDVDSQGFEVIFAHSIPSFAEANMGAAASGILAQAGIGMENVDRFICHPGGIKVVVALEKAFGLAPGTLDDERTVLSEYGNMSSATVLFVLEKALRAGLPARSAMTAMGPGLHRELYLAEESRLIGAIGVLAFVTSERVAELFLARRNTARLLKRGAREVGGTHYGLIVALHAAWLGGLWLLAWDRPVRVVWLLLFAVVQVLRFWVLAVLGERWTTRVIVLPDAPLVKTGPYRFLNHPNYVVVVAEIGILPLVFGLPWYALAFSILNVILLSIRVSVENAALRGTSDIAD